MYKAHFVELKGFQGVSGSIFNGELHGIGETVQIRSFFFFFFFKKKKKDLIYLHPYMSTQNITYLHL
jgi:hypothetical protein